ncbi:MAG: hypothetical protein OEM03_10370 [Chromatiales bacterium]|nr:hypothetical protein [Chromatiales bacterium]
MFIRITLITALLLCCSAANASQDMKLAAHAYELQAGSITLPEKAGRSVMIRGCENCPGVRHTLVKETSYWVDDQQVSLEDLRIAMRSAPEALLVVNYLIKNNNVASIKLIGQAPSNSGGNRQYRDNRSPREYRSQGTSN